jgi:hypothetical protein
LGKNKTIRITGMFIKKFHRFYKIKVNIVILLTI